MAKDSIRRCVRLLLTLVLSVSLTSVPVSASADEHDLEFHDNFRRGCDKNHPAIQELVQEGMWIMHNRFPNMVEALRQGYRPMYPSPDEFGTPGRYWHWINPGFAFTRTEDDYTHERLWNLDRIPLILMIRSHYVSEDMDWTQPTMLEGWTPGGLMFSAFHADHTGIPLYEEGDQVCNPFHWHTARRGQHGSFWQWLNIQRAIWGGETDGIEEGWGDIAHAHFWPSHPIHPFNFYPPFMYGENGRLMWGTRDDDWNNDQNVFGGAANSRVWAPWEAERIQEAVERDIARGLDR